ncbi:hypothetical protein LCGC14_0375200 [marine sediment metagenome]|uniref:Uncharacterized protein n=1 Tax=marine sediment metagenome TaxID=412755 RepID=A0A0F9WCN9_9ZZZZ
MRDIEDIEAEEERTEKMLREEAERMRELCALEADATGSGPGSLIAESIRALPVDRLP